MNALTLIDEVPPMPWKYKVAYLAHKFSLLDQVGCPLTHEMDDDEYIREMFIPQGTLFIGRIHTNGHLVQLMSGDVVNITEAGKQEISGPFEFHSSPGYQAVFYAVTDVVGRTVHKNTERLTDWKLLEDRDFDTAQSLLDRGRMVEQQLLTEIAA